MSTASRAVFLGYPSEDAGAAHRIADALRAAGIEVWFDQSELRGGEACDRKIRKRFTTARSSCQSYPTTHMRGTKATFALNGSLR